jgi:hypothetical protein
VLVTNDNWWNMSGSISDTLFRTGNGMLKGHVLHELQRAISGNKLYATWHKSGKMISGSLQCTSCSFGMSFEQHSGASQESRHELQMLVALFVGVPAPLFPGGHDAT